MKGWNWQNTPNGSVDNSTTQHNYSPIYTFQAIALSVAVIAGFPANIITLIACCYRNRLNVVSNIFIANLCIYELCMILLDFPLSLVNAVNGRQIVTSSLCKFQCIIGTMCSAGIILSLVCVTIDRYFTIVKPMKYGMIMTIRKAVTMIICVWVYVFLLIPAYYIPEVQPTCLYYYEMSSCFTNWAQSPIVGYFILATCYGTALIAMIYTYWRIFVIARHHNKVGVEQLKELTKNGYTNRPSITQMRRKGYKTIKVVIVILITYICCWTPITILAATNIQKFSDMPPWGLAIANCLVVINPTINPIVYGIMSQEYRHSYQRIYRIIRNSQTIRRSLIIPSQASFATNQKDGNGNLSLSHDVITTNHESREQETVT
ncbi:Beta-2 adrenergic receptor [Trichoplax sp. H2]|uniref:G-protein coupled receptors family 1 profile domain-containing protein n=1 Tax=Trichoplax adhaerens TaxID=10228 RepID=B3RLB3_TRIAD|nr:hypothetical protein TRIADDRAFT_51946 [Trichoplax adhaerens]EDV28736.1 hypothetical protein TRIADDRAFT_51946 [Trichoplax adhaerens]RDD41810.1 Beta-2 adrenergic receptor [Trichoplax sp. H2]|eukprot:XP_002107938.1 hypothetical protein TRIADDRAFT_51946 [Trichoplax adhaerens]